MLERVRLRNFKVCRGLDINIAKLTVLAGLNSSGKSSVLQSLALLRQSYTRTPFAGLTLNGDWTSLGTGRDVLSEEADNDELSIGVIEDGQSYSWLLRCPPDAYVLPIVHSPEFPPPVTQRDFFQFLQADRITPATMYPNAPQRVRDAEELGSHGEYTVDFFSRNREREVPAGRRAPDSRFAPTAKLFDQVSAWLQTLSPGVRLDAEQLKGTDSVRLSYRYSGRRRDVTTVEYRPTNVGFGLTYVLPVVVACLAAPSGSILLLENPEAHLHPEGQLTLGRLLGLCVKDGVQIIFETHSDHLLNGIRLAVKRKDLGSSDVAIHFFRRNLETGTVSVESPLVNATGRLSFWPQGFFDQWDKSLDELLD